MNSNIRLKSKYLLLKNTLRLSFISLVSAIIRWGTLALNILLFYFLVRSDFSEKLISDYGIFIFYTGVALLACSALFFTAVISSAVKLGEQFIYFTRAQSSKGSLRLLFKFFHPQKAFRALIFYLKINFMKLFWLVYFLSPAGICTGCAVYLYNTSFLSREVGLILATGAVLLLSISFVVWRVCAGRYSAAPYYLCLNPDLNPREAIKKSIRFTDGLLTEGVLLEYSFAGWILSCILIIPLFYVVPYIKLTKCVYITDIVFSHSKAPKSRYSVTLLNLIQSRQHIN